MFKSKTIILLILFIGFSTFVVNAESNISAIFSNALKYEEQGSNEDAKLLYNSIITQYPACYEARRAIVRASRIDLVKMIQTGKYADANAVITAIVKDYNDCEDIIWFLYSAACTYDEVDDKFERRDDAIRLYDMTVARSTSKCGISAAIKSSRLKTFTLMDAGLYKEADAEFLKMLTEYPDHQDHEWCLFSIGTRYEILKEKNRARQYFNLCVQKFPNSIFGIKGKVKIAKIDAINAINIGMVEEAVGQLDMVLENAEKAPADVKRYLYAVGSLLDEKGYTEAIQFYDNYIEKFSDDKLVTNIKLSRQRIVLLETIDEGDVNSVLINIENLIKTYNDDKSLAWCIYSCASHLDQLGYKKQASQLYKRLNEAIPNNDFSIAAQIKSERIRLVNAIEEGDVDSFEKIRPEVEKYKEDFKGYSDFSDSMLLIFEACHKKGIELDSTIVSLRASASRINSLITCGNFAEIIPAVDKMLVDFNDYPYLPQTLLDMVEKGYAEGELQKDNEKAKSLYRITKMVAKILIEKCSKTASYQMPETYLYVTYCDYQLGQFADVVQNCKIINDKWPEYKYIHYAQILLADSYERLVDLGNVKPIEVNNKIEEAYIAVLEKEGIDEKSFVRASDGISRVGQSYFTIKNWEKAAECFERFLQERPESKQSVDIIYKMGEAYENIGYIEKAISLYENILNNDPNVKNNLDLRLEIQKLRELSGK
jgi:tetratricopeptide (TPR) repeat protein